jgi:hypothetical protein
MKKGGGFKISLVNKHDHRRATISYSIRYFTAMWTYKVG